jgi:hypothetical protein
MIIHGSAAIYLRILHPVSRADGRGQLQYTPAFDDQHPGAASPYALRH